MLAMFLHGWGCAVNILEKVEKVWMTNSVYARQLQHDAGLQTRHVAKTCSLVEGQLQRAVGICPSCCCPSPQRHRGLPPSPDCPSRNLQQRGGIAIASVVLPAR